MWEKTFSSRCLAAASGLYLAVAGISALAAEHNFDGVYTGKRLLTKGSAGPECPAKDDVSVTIHGETLTFTNSALKKYTMPFDPGPDGSFGQIHGDMGGDTVDYHGRIVGDIIDADVTNYGTDPPCEYHWHLKKG
jgi:hypothetical protein